MSPIRDEYELIEHPAWGLFHWNTHEIHLAWHKSTIIIIISKVKMVQNTFRNICSSLELYPRGQVQIVIFQFLVENQLKNHNITRNVPYFIYFLSSVHVWFIGGRVVTSTDILKDILIWFGLSFCIYLYFQPIRIERRLILLFSIGSFQFPRSSLDSLLLPMPRRENQKLSSWK